MRGRAFDLFLKRLRSSRTDWQLASSVLGLSGICGPFQLLELLLEFFSDDGQFMRSFDPQTDSTSGDSDDGNRDFVSDQDSLTDFPA